MKARRVFTNKNMHIQSKAIQVFKPGLTQLEDRSVPAAAGSLDLVFGGTGLVQTDFQGGTDEAHAVAVDALGRYVVVGFTSTATEEEDGPPDGTGDMGPPDGVGGGGGGGEESVPNPLTDFAVARYNANGTLDTTFGIGGKVVVNVSQLVDGVDEEDKAFGVTIDSAGRIVVAGYLNRGTVGTLIDHDFALVRLNSDGTPDTTFGVSGVVVTDFGLNYSDEALDVEIQADGKIVAAGRTGTSSSESAGATADFALARYNTDGSLDTSFGGGDGLVNADLASGSKDEGKRIELMADGRIVMAGMIESEVEGGGGPDFAVARFTASGALDGTFNYTGFAVVDFGGTDEGQDVAIQADGKAIVIGHVGEGVPANFGLARFNLNGALDDTFGTGGKVQTDFEGRADFPFAIGMQSDGKIVAAGRGIPATGGGGTGGTGGGAFQYAVARYNADGTLDTTFGGDGTVLTNFGGPAPDQGYAVAVQDGRIVVAGVAASDFGLAAYRTTEGGDSGGGGVDGGAVPLDDQFTVAAVTGAEAGPPVVTVVNPGGDFVAVWESFQTDGSGIGIYAQAFKADGTPIGAGPTLVNATTGGNQSRPTVASDGAGHFIIAWQSEAETGGEYDVYYTSGSYDGTTETFSLIAGETLVNEVTSGSQTNPTVAMDAQGRFVIAWQSDQNAATTNGIDIFARYGTFDGGLIGTADIDDVTVTAEAGDEVNPDAAMAATEGVDGGKLIVAWTGPGETTSTEEEEATIVIKGTVYDYNQTLSVVTPFTVDGKTQYQLSSTATVDTQHDQVNPDVALNESGRVVLAWQAEGGQGTGSDIFSRRIDTRDSGNGDNVLTFLDASNVPVNVQTSMPQRNPALGVDAAGNYFVTWQSQGVDGRSWGVVGRAFYANGNPVRGIAREFLVNVNVQGPQINPAVSVAPNGSTVAVWAGPFVPAHGEEDEGAVEGEGGHQPAVFARRFEQTGIAEVVPAETATNVNGLEFQLATVGAGEDVPAAATVLSDGTYVVVWQAFEETDDPTTGVVETGDPSGYGIYGQRLAADGTLIGTKFLVNETALGYQSNPSVAALSAGRFVVVWQGEIRGGTTTSPSQYDVYGRLFMPDGSGGLTAGTEFQVNNPDELLTPTDQTAPSVASDGAQKFVVVWQTDAKATDELGTEIYARRYSSASGTSASAVGNEVPVNTVPFVTIQDPVTGADLPAGESQVAPQVAMNAKGEFAVVWVSDHNIAANPEDTEKSIFVRWFNASGVAPNPEFLANVYTKDAQEHPSIGIDAAGDIVVAWQSINQEDGGRGVSWGVFARQFHPDGSSPQEAEFQVNTTVNQPQRFPSIGVDAAGRFAIAWQSINQDGSSWGVYQRQYRSDGTPDTGEQQVNTVTQGPQIQPVFARDAEGNYGIFWSGGMAEHIDGIGGRVYQISNVPTAPNLTVPDSVSGPERVTIPLPITITAVDQDVLETLSVVITGFPADATLSAGTKQPDGSWVLTPAQLAGLTIRLAHEGTYTLTVKGIATEVKSGQQATSTESVTVIAQNLDFAVAGMGIGGAIVNQYALNGSLMRSINAFVGFTGGVTVATGDVTGDATPDIVVGTATGSSHVKVFDGKTGALVRSFFAFPGFAGGVTVAAGDVNGDDFADIVVGAGANGHVKVFDGKTGALARSFFAFPGFAGGVTVATGDVNGDKRADLVVGTASGSSHVKVFDGKTNAVVRSFFAFPGFAGGVTVAAGDENGDNFADIIVGAGPGAPPHVKVFSGESGAVLHSFYAYDPGFRGGVRVAAMDVNGDGLSELMFGPGPGAGPHLMMMDPDTSTTYVSKWAFDPLFLGGIWVG